MEKYHADTHIFPRKFIPTKENQQSNTVEVTEKLITCSVYLIQPALILAMRAGCLINSRKLRCVGVVVNLFAG